MPRADKKSWCTLKTQVDANFQMGPGDPLLLSALMNFGPYFCAWQANIGECILITVYTQI